MVVIELRDKKKQDVINVLKEHTRSKFYSVSIFYFGHGTQEGLIFHDGCFSYYQFQDIINEYENQEKIFILLDCCHSGNPFYFNRPEVYVLASVSSTELAIQTQKNSHLIEAIYSIYPAITIKIEDLTDDSGIFQLFLIITDYYNKMRRYNYLYKDEHPELYISHFKEFQSNSRSANGRPPNENNIHKKTQIEVIEEEE